MANSIDDLKSNKWGATNALSTLDKIRIECGVDEDFRQKFLADPAGVLKSYGVDVPAGMKLNVVQDTPEQYNITIPAYRGNNLSSQGLAAARSSDNGTTWCTTCTTTTPICIGSLASLTCA